MGARMKGDPETNFGIKVQGHPMASLQSRPRGDLWDPVGWVEAEWWRKRLAIKLAELAK